MGRERVREKNKNTHMRMEMWLACVRESKRPGVWGRVSLSTYW